MSGSDNEMVEQLLRAVLAFLREERELRQELLKLLASHTGSRSQTTGSINGRPLPKRTFMWSSEAAKVIGCEPRTIREWIRDGKIRSARREDDNGGKWQIDIDEVHELAAKYQPRAPRRSKSRAPVSMNGERSAARGG
jgi:excisionase family DNA binding protein